MIGRRFVFVGLIVLVVGCSGRASGGADGAAEDEAAACEAEACGAGGPCCEVEDCARCPSDAACVAVANDREAGFVCLEIPAACDGVPTCACLGDLVCAAPMVCEEGDFEGSDLACSCPSCARSVDAPAGRR